MAKSSTHWRQAGVIIFLILLVLGFSIPGFLNLGSTPAAAPEPRLCQTDNECILACERPLRVLCSQNLCLQNSCDEFAAIPYSEIPRTLFLKVLVDGREANVSTRVGDTFVAVFGDRVEVYSREMSLPQVLEKVGVGIGTCLRVGDSNYCPDQTHVLQLRINGNETVSPYFPQENDVIEINYAKIT